MGSKKQTLATIISSGLGIEERAILASVVDALPICIEDDFPHECTNSVLLMPDAAFVARTFKYMMARLLGIPVIRFTWIQECISAGSVLLDRLDEFYVKGDAITRHDMVIPEPNLPQLIFMGCQFRFSPSCIQPPREELEKLAMTGGATISAKSQDSRRKSTDSIDVQQRAFVVSPQRATRRSLLPGENAMTVTEFLDCISLLARPDQE